MEEATVNICSKDTEENSVANKDMEPLYTVDEMAKILKVTTGALKDWTKSKENPCPCFRYKSRILRFERKAVLEWFKERTAEWTSTESC